MTASKRALKIAKEAIKEMYGEQDWKQLLWANNENANKDAKVIASHITAELEKQEKYIAALRSECEAACEVLKCVNDWGTSMLAQTLIDETYKKARAARLAMEGEG